MNGSTENTTWGASEKPGGGRDILLDLETVSRMLGLVRRIVADLLDSHVRLAHMQLEQDRLDRQRRTLTWPERHRRYQLREEITEEEQRNLEAKAELEILGVVLLDADKGRLGFPTIVNDRRAFFSWQPGEEILHFWHYVDETVRRPIPSAWNKLEAKGVRGKS